MGSFRKGLLQKFVANFPHSFLTQSNVFEHNFRKISTEYPQNFPQSPCTNDPISELRPLKGSQIVSKVAVWAAQDPESYFESFWSFRSHFAWDGGSHF